MVSLSDFMADVYKEASEFVEIKEAGGSIVRNHPPLLHSANHAYAQAKGYLCRPLLQGEYSELYIPLHKEFIIRTVPIDKAKSFKVQYIDTLGTMTDISEDEYDLLQDRIQFQIVYDRILLTYTGGWALAKDNEELFTALVAQTMANYRRRDFLGTTSFMRGESVGTSISNKGGLIDMATQVLDGLVYYGDCADW